MYLHVGNNRNVRIKTVIGIFDMDNSTVSTVTRKFLGSSQKNMRSRRFPRKYQNLLYCMKMVESKGYAFLHCRSRLLREE